jgi:hypothetical protein
MYKIVCAAAFVAALSAPAFSATLTAKTSNSNGSDVGVASSSWTQNGAAIGGGTNGSGQTQSPGSRAFGPNGPQTIHAGEGTGSLKP